MHIKNIRENGMYQCIICIPKIEIKISIFTCMKRSIASNINEHIKKKKEMKIIIMKTKKKWMGKYTKIL